MSDKPRSDTKPPFAPEGVVWKEYTQTLPFEAIVDQLSQTRSNAIGGMYAEVLGGWLVMPFHVEKRVVFVPRPKD